MFAEIRRAPNRESGGPTCCGLLRSASQADTSLLAPAIVTHPTPGKVNGLGAYSGS